MTAQAIGFQPDSAGISMAEFRTVGKVGDLAEGQGKTVLVGDKLIALFCSQGQLCAIDDTCPHMGASLAAGDLEDGIVTCAWHGWRFKVADGTWADNPRIKIGSYPVRVVGDEIQIACPTTAAKDTGVENG